MILKKNNESSSWEERVVLINTGWIALKKERG